jgi:acyl carrier protein
MDEQQILDVLTRALRDLLMDETVVLTMSTRREDVRNWDSLVYVNFIVAVEMQLGIKFKVADVESFGNVGDIVTQIKTMLR